MRSQQGMDRSRDQINGLHGGSKCAVEYAEFTNNQRAYVTMASAVLLVLVVSDSSLMLLLVIKPTLSLSLSLSLSLWCYFTGGAGGSSCSFYPLFHY